MKQPNVIQPLPRAKIRHPDVIEARERAHAAFDQLWKSGRMTRDAAYAWLRNVMKLSPREAHIGRMHPEQCEKLVAYVAEKIDKASLQGMTGNLPFGDLRAAVPKMEPILKTELMRILLEDADHTVISAIVANTKNMALMRQLEEAREDTEAYRVDALAELDGLRRMMAEHEALDAAERLALRERVETLETVARNAIKRCGCDTLVPLPPTPCEFCDMLRAALPMPSAAQNDPA